MRSVRFAADAATIATGVAELGTSPESALKYSPERLPQIAVPVPAKVATAEAERATLHSAALESCSGVWHSTSLERAQATAPQSVVAVVTIATVIAQVAITTATNVATTDSDDSECSEWRSQQLDTSSALDSGCRRRSWRG